MAWAFSVNFYSVNVLQFTRKLINREVIKTQMGFYHDWFQQDTERRKHFLIGDWDASPDKYFKVIGSLIDKQEAGQSVIGENQVRHWQTRLEVEH